MKRSVKLVDLERDLGLKPNTLGYDGNPPVPGEGSIIEWQGRRWKIILLSHSRGLVLLED